MERVTETNVWGHWLSARQARKVAQALRAEGYSTATYENCTEYVINVARRFEPGDAAARHKLLGIICQAAGIQPVRSDMDRAERERRAAEVRDAERRLHALIEKQRRASRREDFDAMAAADEYDAALDELNTARERADNGRA